VNKRKRNILIAAAIVLVIGLVPYHTSEMRQMLADAGGTVRFFGPMWTYDSGPTCEHLPPVGSLTLVQESVRAWMFSSLLFNFGSADYCQQGAPVVRNAIESFGIGILPRSSEIPFLGYQHYQIAMGVTVIGLFKGDASHFVLVVREPIGNEEGTQIYVSWEESSYCHFRNPLGCQFNLRTFRNSGSGLTTQQLAPIEGSQ
jgi:hypothetical protein